MATATNCKTVTAIFIGRDMSLGYKTGDKYTLSVYSSTNNSIVITRFGDSEGICVYTNITTFLDNWNRIKTV